MCRCPVVSTVVRVLTSDCRPVCSGLGFCVCVLFCLNVFVVYFLLIMSSLMVSTGAVDCLYRCSILCAH